MTSPPPIVAPAGFVPTAALAFADPGGRAVGVEAANPLPVAVATAPARSIPLTGSTAASLVAGPFDPQLDRPVWLRLAGDWTGQVTLERSLDGGATRAPLTVGGRAWARFAGNVQEPVAEETVAGASYWLDIVLRSGTLSFEVRQ